MENGDGLQNQKKDHAGGGLGVGGLRVGGSVRHWFMGSSLGHDLIAVGVKAEAVNF